MGILALFAAFGAVFGILWILWNSGIFLPRWIEWRSGRIDEATGQYEVTLKHRAVKVVCDNDVIWTTPKEVKVQDALSCDIDGDGAQELVLLCWKVGRFGESRPFWVEEDEKTWSQHIFVYSYSGDTMRPKWMSSYIGVDVTQMSVRERDGKPVYNETAQDDAARDGAALNGGIQRQHLILTDTEGRMSSWIWDSWGFTKEDTDISFVLFGDNLIHEQIYLYSLHKNEGNFDFLFENRDIIDIIAKSDIAVINQETPLTDEPSRYSGYPRFGTPVGVGEAISDAGFDIVTCATNHMMDQGVAGVNFTKEFFDACNIVCIGIQSEDEEEYRPYEIIVRGGIRFGLLNYTYGINGNQIPENRTHMVHLLDDEEQIRADLAKAKAETDFVLVFVHWGTEYEQQPDEFQKKWTQVFLESMADVVVGTHPHTLQPYEMLRGEDGHEMLVYYSVGNYISAQTEQSCVKGGMAQFTVSFVQEGYKITEYTLQPLEIIRQENGKYTVDVLSESYEKITPNL